MKAEAVSFLEDFIRNSVGAQYIIPVYQRNYNWKKDLQVKKLLEDIDTLLENNKKIHFMGSLIYIVTVDGLIGQERSVVDGQQRLTTLFLMMYALRDISLETNQNDIAVSITSLYLENQASVDKYKLRLKPSVSDDDCFEKIAARKFDDIEDEKSNVLFNYQYIREYFEDRIEKYSIDQIVNALRRLNIVYIRLDENDDAQLIFESINSTGMDLTSADLIRNFILMNRDNDTQEMIYNDYWRKVEKIFVDSKKLEMFFRLFIGVKQCRLVNKNKVYNSFREYWNKVVDSKCYIEILTDILNYATHYNLLYYKSSNVIYKKEIDDFRKINSDIPATFVLETLELERKNIITAQQVKEVIQIINTYMIRRYIVNKQTKEISRTFPTCLKNVLEYCNNNTYSVYVDATKRFLINNNKLNTAYMPNDKEVKDYLLTANAYVMKHLKWLLAKIEMKDNVAIIDFSNLSIEHIMPQTKNDEWENIADISDEEYDNYKHRLGNLTLATERDNSSMGNKFFDYKRKVLSKTSHIRMNQNIIQKQRWGLEEINQRSEELITVLMEMFPYVMSNKSETVNRDIYIQIRGEIIAQGRLNIDNSVTIYADSRVKIDTLPATISAKQKRDELLANDTLVEENSEYILSENCDFNSPSTAAEFVLGGSKNGWEIWKGYDGLNIDSLFSR